jgi:hypothetical protein
VVSFPLCHRFLLCTNTIWLYWTGTPLRKEKNSDVPTGTGTVNIVSSRGIEAVQSCSCSLVGNCGFCFVCVCVCVGGGGLIVVFNFIFLEQTQHSISRRVQVPAS